MFLNGTSSSGKTSISSKLVKQESHKFHHLSIDEFCEGLFKSYAEFINIKYPNLEPTNKDDEQKIVQIITDPIISMYYSTIKMFSEVGMNVVVDTVIDNEERLNHCIDLLKDQPTIFVGVKCSKEELVRRENHRGDRQIGLAISQTHKVHVYGEYDIELDTEAMTPTECALHIIDFIESKKDYFAFKKLAGRS